MKINDAASFGAISERRRGHANGRVPAVLNYERGCESCGRLETVRNAKQLRFRGGRKLYLILMDAINVNLEWHLRKFFQGLELRRNQTHNALGTGVFIGRRIFSSVSIVEHSYEDELLFAIL